MAGIPQSEYDKIAKKATRLAAALVKQTYRETWDEARKSLVPTPGDSYDATYGKRDRYALKILRQTPEIDQFYEAEYQRLKKEFLDATAYYDGHTSQEYREQRNRSLAEGRRFTRSAQVAEERRNGIAPGAGEPDEEECYIEVRPWTPGSTVGVRQSVFDRHGIIGRKRPETILSRGAFQD